MTRSRMPASRRLPGLLFLSLVACSSPYTTPAPPAPGALPVDWVYHCGNALGIAVSSKNVAYLAVPGRHQLCRFDLPSRAPSEQEVATVWVPTDVAFTADGRTAFVASANREQIGVVSVDGDQKEAPIRTKGSGTPTHLYVSPDGAALLVTTERGTLDMMDIATQRWTTIDLDAEATGLAFDPRSALVYLATVRGSLYALDRAAGTVLKRVDLVGMPGGVVVSTDGSRLFIANETGPLEVRSAATLEHIAEVPAAEGAFHTAASPDGTLLFVTRPTLHDVLILDVQNYEVMQRIVGGMPTRVAFDRDGTTAMITNAKNYVTFVRLSARRARLGERAPIDAPRAAR